MLLAYWRCTVAAMPPWPSRSAHSVASARFGAVVRRFMRKQGLRTAGTIARLMHVECLSSRRRAMPQMSPTVRVDQHGAADAMYVTELPVGDPGPGEIR